MVFRIFMRKTGEPAHADSPVFSRYTVAADFLAFHFAVAQFTI